MPKIVSCKSVGKQTGYDLQVPTRDHQFYLSNGLLTSNSHSDAYTVMTMQCAHLATYYPLEFYTAVLTCAQSGEIQEYVSDITRQGIKVLPVDINLSGMENRIEGKGIRLSFTTVLGLGPAAVQKIMAGQPYTDFLDFLYRSGASKTAIEPLILVGAFRDMEPNMKRLQQRYDAFVENPKYKTKKLRPEYERLFTEWPEVEDYQLHEKVFLENQFLGFSVTGSPFEILDRKRKIEVMFDGVARDYKEFMESDELVAMLPVVVKDFKERAQRNGQLFAFIKFGVESGEEFEAPAFSSVWKHISKSVRKGSVYVVTFNRKEDSMESLLVGKPGFAQSQHSAQTAFINVDEITL